LYVLESWVPASLATTCYVKILPAKLLTCPDIAVLKRRLNPIRLTRRRRHRHLRTGVIKREPRVIGHCPAGDAVSVVQMRLDSWCCHGNEMKGPIACEMTDIYFLLCRANRAEPSDDHKPH